MQKNNYYALYSNDALGVFTDYYYALDCSIGLKKNRIKKFPSYKMAYEYAKDGYDDLQDDIRYMTFYGIKLGLDRLVDKENVRRQRNG